MMVENNNKKEYEYVTYGDSLIWMEEGYYTQEQIEYFLVCFANRQKALKESMKKK